MFKCTTLLVVNLTLSETYLLAKCLMEHSHLHLDFNVIKRREISINLKRKALERRKSKSSSKKSLRVYNKISRIDYMKKSCLTNLSDI